MGARSSIFVVGALGAGAVFLACVSDQGANLVTAQDASTDGSNLFDAGTQQGLDVNSPPIDAGPDATPPDVLTNDAGALAVWLVSPETHYAYDADAGAGTWTDVSGHHNDGISGSTAPLIYPDAVNGHAALDFNQGDAFLDIADNATVEFGDADVLVAAVVRQVSNEEPCNVWAKSKYGPSGGAPNYQGGLELFTAVAKNDAGTQFADLTTRFDTGTAAIDWGASLFDNAFHRIAVRRSGGGGTLTLYADGNTRSTSVNPNSSLDYATYAVVIGGKSPQVNFNGAVDIQIAELVALHGTLLTDEDVSSVMTYFSAKYALP